MRAGRAEMSFILYHESRSVRSCVYTCMCSLDSGVATAGRGEASCPRYGERGRKAPARPKVSEEVSESRV